MGIVECIFMILSWMGAGFALAWCIQADRRDTVRRELEQERSALQLECVKLVDHVLWLTHDESLGGEMDIGLLPSHISHPRLVLPGGHILPEKAAQKVPERNPIDTLLDMLETAEVTGIRSEPFGVGDEVDQRCHGLKPMVTLEFGDVSVRDMAIPITIESMYIPDLCWKGHLLPELSGEQMQRLHRIFCDRIVKEAAKSLKKPVNSQVNGIMYERDM